MEWRVIVHQNRLSPAENMAIDEAILLGNIAGTSTPTIRFYEWEPATASIGYNQSAKKEVDFDLLHKYNYGFVRRPTGGRLVLHNDEITYAVISKTVERLAGNITKSYSEISKALAAGLQKIGVDVAFEKGVLSSAHQREANNPCFTSASKYELKYKKKKIVGSAQVRKEDCLLQHGSILLDYSQNIVADIIPNLDSDKREKLKRYLGKKTICINEILKNEINF
ncbi:MAG: octanoyltransferase, partial [Candidatus Cloacimonadota bacterium]|nr:octanoyltransferase [Candidatus Cloacimonadota bacterium]